MELIGDVIDKNVVLIDDMVDTAGTLATAGDLITERGAKSVRAVCTHAVLSGNAYEKIEKSKLLELIVTDTVPKIKLNSKINKYIRILSNKMKKLNNLIFFYFLTLFIFFFS